MQTLSLWSPNGAIIVKAGGGLPWESGTAEALAATAGGEGRRCRRCRRSAAVGGAAAEPGTCARPGAGGGAVATAVATSVAVAGPGPGKVTDEGGKNLGATGSAVLLPSAM